MENLYMSKVDMERVEKEWYKCDKEWKKKYIEMELFREKFCFDIRGKYGIKKRKGYELVEIYIGILMLWSEKEFLLFVVK